MSYILDFGQISKKSFDQVGGKNASLGEMYNKGLKVPWGFAVTTDAYYEFIKQSGIKDALYRLLADLEAENITAVAKASAEVRAMIEKSPIPKEIEQEIVNHYKLMEKKYGKKDIPVAVRSSATAEDLPNASFAGQQDTYLWIKGAKNIVDAIKRCWASLFTSRAVSYRIKNNFPHDKVLISVGVQKMVEARVSGVMFTLNPSNGDLSQVVIEGSWGLGEAVVGGTVTPDHFMIDKIVGEINTKQIAYKHIECVPCLENGGVKEIEVPEERQNISSLKKEEVIELAKIAKVIEEHYGCPQDIEWAIDRGGSFPENLFILQSRPETVWSQKKAEPRLAKKSSFDFLMERATKVIRA